MTTLNITARKWSGGWELWHGDDVWTQVRTLSRARQQVIDYLDTVEEGIDHSNLHIEIVPEIPFAEEVEYALESSHRAAQASNEASRSSRKAVRHLREEGLSLADIGYIMGLSRARVSQLAGQ